MSEPLAEPIPGTAQEPAPEKPKAKPTEYHILRLASSSGADESWSIVARNIEGVGAKDAIKRTVTPTEQRESYIAVPSRSFKPVTVKLQMTAQTIIE
jgi:hypothetical protein